jgi:hypothetical protein
MGTMTDFNPDDHAKEIRMVTNDFHLFCLSLEFVVFD